MTEPLATKFSQRDLPKADIAAIASSELKQEQPDLGQMPEIQKRLKDLDVSTADLHDYTRKLPLGIITVD